MIDHIVVIIITTQVGDITTTRAHIGHHSCQGIILTGIHIMGTIHIIIQGIIRGVITTGVITTGVITTGVINNQLGMDTDKIWVCFLLIDSTGTKT
jgi:hypothetical protein